MPSDPVWCNITGHDIYYQMYLPAVPRKGDILWLGSLSEGRVPINEVIVSKVEWAMDQTSRHVHVWLTVRRRNTATTVHP